MLAREQKTIDAMRRLTFGIEIEAGGKYRREVADVIKEVVGGYTSHVGYPRCYDPWHVSADDGRKWVVMADQSLSSFSFERRCEVVSPILRYDDIPTVQKIVRALRAAGLKVNRDCGIHVHIGANALDARALINLAKNVNKQEELIHAGLGVQRERLSSWCWPVNQNFVREISKRGRKSRSDLNKIWYRHCDPGLRAYGYRYDPGRTLRSWREYDPSRATGAGDHYNRSRYHGLNFHNVWFRGTVEFRWFEGTLHAGKVKAFVHFAMALAAKAIGARHCSPKKREFRPESAKYDFRVFLLDLGLIGDTFKTARLFLCGKKSPLASNGSSAYRYGRPVTPRITSAHEAVESAGECEPDDRPFRSDGGLVWHDHDPARGDGERDERPTDRRARLTASPRPSETRPAFEVERELGEPVSEREAEREIADDDGSVAVEPTEITSTIEIVDHSDSQSPPDVAGPLMRQLAESFNANADEIMRRTLLAETDDPRPVADVVGFDSRAANRATAEAAREHARARLGLGVRPPNHPNCRSAVFPLFDERTGDYSISVAFDGMRPGYVDAEELVERLGPVDSASVFSFERNPDDETGRSVIVSLRDRGVANG